jgi:eukaryotic-like serine/threonine-protein kinase
MSTGDRSADRDPLDLLAEEFVARHRRGEHPALAEYVEAYPELADQIEELFPSLLMMEQIKPAEGNLAPNLPGDRFPQQSIPSPIGRLGDFRILRVLGRGGMGVVYEAIQESLGRHVALKVLPPLGRLDATQLGRFRREARAAAGLHHTNIVPVFAVGEQDGVPYYAMQFIRGQGLDTILDELTWLRCDGTAAGGEPDQGSNDVQNSGPGIVDGKAVTAAITQGLLSGRFAISAGQQPESTATDGARGITSAEMTAPRSPERSDLISQPGAQYFRTIARIGAQTADALAYAHALGICHRDIKPSNLLLDACGIIWIADFGLAKADNGDGEGLTHTGDVVGTLRYMAPERFNGWADARSDVYALGVTLYEMLTLRPAFVESDRLKLIDRIANGAVPKPRSIDPRIPGDLETIVSKAMARDPGERYISVHFGTCPGGRSGAVPGRPHNPRSAKLSARADLALVPPQSRHRRASGAGHIAAGSGRNRVKRGGAGLDPAARSDHESRARDAVSTRQFLDRGRGGSPAHRDDRPALQQPGQTRRGRECLEWRSRGLEPLARDP